MEFLLKTTISAPAKDIYTAWLDSAKHTEMTGGEAEISDKIGGKFTAWDGYIKGKNLILEPYSRIVQTWRTTQFTASEEHSQIEILLEEKNGVTELTLKHYNLPNSGEHYKKGWELHYFSPMREYFSTK